MGVKVAFRVLVIGLALSAVCGKPAKRETAPTWVTGSKLDKELSKISRIPNAVALYKALHKKTWNPNIKTSWLREQDRPPIVPEPRYNYAACPGPVVLTDSTGSIQSPRFPNQKYHNNMDCSWRISATQGQHIKLTTQFFNIESDYSTTTDECDSGCTCPFDYLDIIEGSDVSASPVGHHCGNEGPEQTYQTNVLTLHFISDASVKRWGFNIDYEFVSSGDDSDEDDSVDGGDDNACIAGQTAILSGAGVINSPIGDASTGTYPNYADCEWMIEVDAGDVIRLHFNSFSVETGANCRYDVLTIYDGASPSSNVLGNFCGTDIPGDITSSTNKLLIHFTSDHSVTQAGFQIEFSPETSSDTSVACEAGQTAVLTGEGTITSPVEAGTNSYPNYADCSWRIEAPAGSSIKLEFEEFSVEVGTNCRYDALAVYDGNTEQDDVLGYMCGSGTPADIVSTSNEVLIRFTSDFSVQDTGFEIHFMTIAGGGGDGGDSNESVEATTTTTTATTTPATTTTSASSGGNGGGPAGGGGSGPNGNSGSDTTTTTTTTTTTAASTTTTADNGNNGGSNNGGDDGEVACGVVPASARIVGGFESEENAWPWQISLRYWGYHICGGSVISKRWIATAAHCVSTSENDITPASYLQIIAGAHLQDYSATESGRQIRNVVQVISHNEYYSLGKDIALLELDEDLEWTDDVRPVCIPTSAVADGTDCVITGWGETEDTGDNANLLQATVPIISHSTCSSYSYYGSYVNQYMVCAGYAQGGIDTCQGDSGGPLVCPDPNGAWVLHGITSWGSGCADAYKPGVYARVSEVTAWVDTNTNGEYFTN